MEISNMERFERKTLRHSTTGSRSTLLEMVTDMNTGKTELELSYKVMESVELNDQNLQSFKDKFDDMNPSSGFVPTLESIADYINHR